MRLTKLTSLFIIPIVTVLCCALAFSTALPTNATSSVKDVCSNPNVAQEIKEASGCGGSTKQLDDVVQSILNGVVAVAGTVAVIFIVVGGFNYMTSAGDANKVTKARNTIMYACIGLAICALSFIIVNFVIVDLIGAGGTGGTGEGGVATVGDDEHGLVDFVHSIINGVIAVLGTVCVIVMIVGGFNYMSSGGDTAKVQKAKNTLLYGTIGLIICVLAFAIVNFVIVNIISGKKPEGVPASITNTKLQLLLNAVNQSH